MCGSLTNRVILIRAMEEKKRAMAEAEEKRRRKALEDRRQSQQQATDRFRSAVGRIKFSKPTTAGRKLNLPGNWIVIWNHKHSVFCCPHFALNWLVSH